MYLYYSIIKTLECECAFVLILAGCLIGSAQKKITVRVESEMAFAGMEMFETKKALCTDIRKEGAFGGVSSTSAVTNITSFQGSGSAIQSLSVPGEYDFEVKVEYFLKIGDMAELADAKGFKKLFPDQKSKINSILKSRKTDFDKEADIIELIKEITSR